MEKKRIVIVGGGASGIFASLRCADLSRERKLAVEVIVLEATSHFLKKVKISGGGRCNVTHHQFEVREFCQNYPRGQKELLSPFHRFQATDTVEWFKKRGIQLKYERDGRMFPVTDKSQTVIDCFLGEADRLGVRLQTNKNVKSVKALEDGRFSLMVNDDEFIEADALLLATGSSPRGYKLAKQLEHTITDLAPSLFSFKIEDAILEGLSGTSFKSASLTLKVDGLGKKTKDFKQKGPLLITHWGLSGPALLKLSAWAAREMKVADYRAEILVNWLGVGQQKEVEVILESLRETQGKSMVSNAYPRELTKRFWQQVLVKCEIFESKRWSEVSKKEFNRLVQNLFSCRLTIDGKNRYKDEFVECGGVSLKEIDFKKMQSRKHSGLHFSGELMDIDGITGGFNFQNAWTSGWIAAENMVDHIS